MDGSKTNDFSVRFIALGITEFGLSPLGMSTVGWNQRNRTSLSNVSTTAFFVPNLSPNWTIGLGPSFVIPAGDGPINSGMLSVGPAFLGYYNRGALMVGARIRNVWSIAVDRRRDDVHRFIAQPLIRYQFRTNWYFTSSPIICLDDLL